MLGGNTSAASFLPRKMMKMKKSVIGKYVPALCVLYGNSLFSLETR